MLHRFVSLAAAALAVAGLRLFRQPPGAAAAHPGRQVAPAPGHAARAIPANAPRPAGSPGSVHWAPLRGRSLAGFSLAGPGGQRAALPATTGPAVGPVLSGLTAKCLDDSGGGTANGNKID